MKIAIASGKGGTGKTLLATNLFAVIRDAGRSVALVDCDAEVPNDSVFVRCAIRGKTPVKMLCPEINTEACRMCGECARNCAFHAITCIPQMNYIKLLADLCHGCAACIVECPHEAIREGWKQIGEVTALACDGGQMLYEGRIREGEHSPVEIIREAIAEGEASGADVLILDAPPGCSCPFINTVSKADRVVLITEPTPFGLSDLQHAVEVLRRIGKSFSVVINRCDLGTGIMQQWLRDEGIEVLAEIPYSEEVARLYSAGKLVVEHSPAMREIMEGITQKLGIV